ncbi:D-beta-hydroxybutyrate dehydrogenase, mitochondrial [Eumeta japonica]|uniref:D-beta-hydroxybutyrate dehydrogenase, mitochondrial n=1 Tax=Eumeta variegata TaxID=151549 RepID=A0A4C1U5J1_EUMVA|nr:D-beta-hydroxybutyrate dehydrogenase, mitochondrial [Eumeta japonica]
MYRGPKPVSYVPIDAGACAGAGAGRAPARSVGAGERISRCFPYNPSSYRPTHELQIFRLKMLSRVVAITGCDSGLGWAMAARAAREGLITVAGLYKEGETPASKALTALCAHTCPLDVTNQSSVENFKSYVAKLLMENPDYKLYAVVNNAGVMTIGDYEWQTPEMIERPIAVNLLGSMRVVSAFLPELRKIAIENVIKPRIINVVSHCGLQPLPGFGPYCASKAGVIAWTRALRMELQPYGLNVSTFIPGTGVALKEGCGQMKQLVAEMVLTSHLGMVEGTGSPWKVIDSVTGF